ncbi:ATP-binding protein [Actinomadura opuntiae]|uniref:ATP-binding protein n=1 Tax=Actinomadura sp. OS1-43 TaxID=604315 RepID=UPI00255AC049|nr:ATP-binding protein [Actinomadura sp. OS1-43]MDL4812860.1 ATP-binding protein [Actinomadura sp. OS1-43]
MGADGSGIDTTSADTTSIQTTGRGEATCPGGAVGERAPLRDDPGAAPWQAWELPDDPRTAARARALTVRALAAWHVTDPADIDDIVLVVDELVTNAVVHGTGPVRLALRLDGARLTGEVGDADPAAPPDPAPAAPRGLDWSEAGRGLLLVAALATGFGARTHPAGKTVWFTRDLNRLNGQHPATATAPPVSVPVTADAGLRAAPPPHR